MLQIGAGRRHKGFAEPSGPPYCCRDTDANPEGRCWRLERPGADLQVLQGVMRATKGKRLPTSALAHNLHLELRVLETPPQRAQANAICERVLGTLRRVSTNTLITPMGLTGE
jgi:hypothetical protein